MILVERYLFRQLAIPVMGALAALTAVATLSQTLSFLSVIVQNGQSPWVLIKITALAMPPLLALILPIALFVGLLIGLNRLQTEQEVVICFAAGMSRWRVIQPAVRLATLFTLTSLVLTVWVQPLAFRALRNETYKVKTDLAATLVRGGEFVQSKQGLTVYVQSVDQSGLLRNPFIYVPTPGGAQAYAAEQGRIVKHGDRPELVLRRGSTEEFSPRGVLNYLVFDEYVFDLSPYINNDEPFRLKASDLWLHELIYPNLDLPWERKNRVHYLAELHSRLSSSLYSLTLAALALAGVLGGPFSRMGYGRRIARAAMAAVLARIVGFGVAAACESFEWLNFAQYVVPLVPIWLSMRTLFRQRITRYVRLASDQPSLLPEPSAT
jgi:lipopolysaccharide export system permease protein